jgi:methylmalonyl-CoA epimerase
MERIAHIGIAVKNIDQALRLYESGLGLPLHGKETVPTEGVTVAFLPVGDTEIELLEPTSADSPIARFIEKRGEGIHHIAFIVEDIQAAMSRLKEQGFELIDQQPRTGAGGSQVAFVHPKSAGGALIELCQNP